MSGEGSPGSGIFFKPGGLPQADAAVPAAVPGAGAPSDGAAAPTPALPDHPRSIGKFRITRRLGTGGMGVVFEAEQERPRRTVALKVIRSSVLSPKAIRRFEFEVEVLARLQHPGIAQIFETGTFDEGEGPQPYFAMELVSGLPIDRFANEKSLDLESRITLLLKICDAVQHAHQRGIIHRDLKPTNVLVDHSGLPKILDFGVATTTAADISLTLSQSDFQYAAGTLPYLSPEQLTTEPRAPDMRGDVYALGVVAYELITGRLPYEFRSGSLLEAAEVIRHQEPTRPSTFNRLLRGDIEIILRKAIEKDPERRYQSVSDLAADLGRFLRHEPLPMVKGPGLAYQLRKFTQRHKALVAGGAAVFLVLLAGIAATSWQAVRATRSDRESRERFNDLRRLANTVIFELEPAIRDLPGSTPARWILLSSTREYLDGASRDAGDDRDLLAELAAGYHQQARVQGMPATRNLGDTDGSLRNLRQAVDLWEKVVAFEGAPDQAMVDLLTARRDIVILLKWQQRFDEAVHEASIIRERSLSAFRADPANLASAEQFVRSCKDLIAVLRSRNAAGDIALAQTVAGELIELLAACRTSPDTPDDASHLGMVYFGLAVIHDWLKQPQNAIRCFDTAEALLGRAAREAPSRDRSLDHADTFRYRAAVCEQLQDMQGAVQARTIALDLYTRTAEAHPGHYATEQVRTTAEFDLALCLLRSGDLERALPHSRHALARAQSLLDSDPSSRNHRSTARMIKSLHGGLLLQAAETTGLTDERRRALLLEARETLRAATAAIEEGRHDGSAPDLDGFTASVPDDLARCDEALAALDAADPAGAAGP